MKDEIKDLADYHAGLSARLDNALECQDYDDVGVLADLIAECEQDAAKLDYAIASEMQDDGSFRATWLAAGRSSGDQEILQSRMNVNTSH